MNNVFTPKTALYVTIFHVITFFLSGMGYLPVWYWSLWPVIAIFTLALYAVVVVKAVSGAGRGK